MIKQMTIVVNGWKMIKSAFFFNSLGYGSNSFVPYIIGFLNSLPTSRLLITFANSLDPDQARQNVGPDLDPNCLKL